MKGYIVFSEELDLANAVTVFPPVVPIAPGRLACPLDRSRDIADGSIEPKVEYLVLEASLRHGDTP
jgi:hypothetical protein